MPNKTVTLVNASGLHARPAAIFARRAAGYNCDVEVSKDDRRVNAKSVLSVLTLDCHQGDALVIHTDGSEAAQALADLVALVESGIEE